MSDVGRNDPCPCGFGKKYKRCCLLKGGVATRYTRADRELALTTLDEFMDGPGWTEIEEDAEELFWLDLDPDETAIGQDEIVAQMSEQVFDWWLFFDYGYSLERRVVDAFLESSPDLSPGARYYLTLAAATKMWVYQVTEVRPGAGMTLRDVITGQETRVAERSGSRSLHRWDVIATRIMPGGAPGEPVLDGGLLPIGPMRAQPLIEWLQEIVNDDVEGELDGDHITPQLHAAWITPMKMPGVVNYDGDPILLAHVYFHVIDESRMMAALGAEKKLHRVEKEGTPPRWAWHGKGKDRKELVTYGWFSLRGARLEFETNSAKRAERGRKLIDRVVGDAVKYRVTRTEDMEQAMNAMKASGAAEPEPLAPELFEAGHAAVEQYQTEQYERWLDEPVPLFDGMTPLDAAQSAKLRPRVVEMLKELEGHYERALSDGEAAFDPTWMWEALGLDGEQQAPGFRRQAPILGHEALARHFPELEKVARPLARRLREQAGSKDLTRLAGEDDLAGDLAYQRLARECPSPEFAQCAVTTLTNFELHLRKVFWVGESLSWMLGATKLDVTGEAVRLPFQSLAFVFTDRYALGLAERMDSRLPAGLRVGRMLQVLTVYVSQTTGDGADSDCRTLDLTFVGDVLDGTPPSMVPCRLELQRDARLGQILHCVSPGVAELDEDDTVRPLYQSMPLTDLLALVVNALLYATSADAEVSKLDPPKRRKKKLPKAKASTLTSETVFYLPGTIDIKTLSHIKKARRGGRDQELSRRCMVRGHWRRAPGTWKDQRPRWVKPHWRGPSAAAIVERQYRLDE